MPPGSFLRERYITLAVPVVCCVYYAWILYGPPPGGRAVPVGLLALGLLMLPLNNGEGSRFAGEWHRALEAFDKDRSSGMPAYRLIPRHRSFFPLIMGDEFQTNMNMQKLRRAGIGRFREMWEDPAFRVIPIPASSGAADRVVWEPEEGKGRGMGPGASLTYPLPGPTFVAGVRFRCELSDPTIRQFEVSYRRSGQADFPKAAQWSLGGYTWRSKEWTVYVGETIDGLRFQLGEKPCDFHISGIELLVPESEAGATVAR